MPRSTLSPIRAAHGAPSGPSRPAGCNVSELFAMLGQPHMLSILATLIGSGPGSLRFTEIQNRLHLSPKTLSSRLRTLVEGGFATRHAFREIPPRVEYQATAKLVQLGTLFDLLRGWAEENTMHATLTVSVTGKVPARTVPLSV
ncbi:MAG: helix-turn-helix transcriptional regulator [Thermoplasmata archaeon]|nr:helix-turn-helix transcriptional regulator [Thermoplasmata archaeon]